MSRVSKTCAVRPLHRGSDLLWVQREGVGCPSQGYRKMGGQNKSRPTVTGPLGGVLKKAAVPWLGRANSLPKMSQLKELVYHSSAAANKAKTTGLELNKLPGFGSPLCELPEWNHWDRPGKVRQRFPHAIVDFVASKGVTVRERRMLEFINQITDKPEWVRKVFSESIVAKWKEEACRRDESLKDEILSQQMFDFCIAELRDKAERFQKTGMVAVLDAEATIVKADTLIPSELKQALRNGVYPLENVQDHLKDWHPGSDEKVLDLVHPSLFPLTYGFSRALSHGTVPLATCAAFTGMGQTIEKSDQDFQPIPRSSSWGNTSNLRAWGSYQWLPSDIHFTPKGGVKITSYINNLHPNQHEKLYGVLEQFIHLTIPLWNECLSWFYNRIRIKLAHTGEEDWVLPEGLTYQRAPDPRDEDRPDEGSENSEDRHSDDSDFYRYDEAYLDWKKQHRLLTQREPEDFVSFAQSLEGNPNGACPVDLRKDFSESGLQVIFKLANIQLTSEKPTYDGSSWHVEGALNEHICATALYYYDSNNVTDCKLEFRQSIDTEEMTMKPDQNEWDSLEEYYGVENEEPAIQELGSVSTRENRMLAFPNILQHRVPSFQLADPSQPGHRKLLVMFLIDPHIRILSTAHVPPQRKDWWALEVRKIDHFVRLPRELFDRIIYFVKGFPMDWTDAIDTRDKLMEERGAINDGIDAEMNNDTFFFCEH